MGLQDLQNFLFVCVFLAAAWIITVNFRANKNKCSDRELAINLPKLAFVDIYLKISTGLVAVFSIISNNPLVLELYESTTLILIGSLVAFCGLILFIWALRSLGDQFSPCYATKVPSELIFHGPYKIIRHPVYSGGILMVFGIMVASGSIWMILNLIVLIIYLIPTIKREEKLMFSEFDQYNSYMSKTGRLMPKLPSFSVGQKPAGGDSYS